jgi:hypothetical protein
VNVPAVGNDWLNVPEDLMPESQIPFGEQTPPGQLPEVVEWLPPAHVQRTVSPTAMLTVGGLNMKLLIVTSWIVPLGVAVIVGVSVGVRVIVGGIVIVGVRVLVGGAGTVAVKVAVGPEGVGVCVGAGTVGVRVGVRVGLGPVMGVFVFVGEGPGGVGVAVPTFPGCVGVGVAAEPASLRAPTTKMGSAVLPSMTTA